jgi:hypothetical protein
LHNRVAILPGSANLGMVLGLSGVASLFPLLLAWAVGAVVLRRSLR